MELRNILNFEAKGLTRSERLSLILHAADLARDRCRSDVERQELDFIYQDCQAALSQISAWSSAEETWLDKRMERMIRVLNYYEAGYVKLSRRYWWLLLAAGLVLLVLAILYGTPHDLSSI